MLWTSMNIHSQTQAKNTPGHQISITINNQDIYPQLSKSYISIKDQLTLVNNTAYAAN